jgi:uncharacterized protein (DUF488 family)
VSIGYAGRTAEALCDELVHHGVCILVDVRLNAISRKPGFSKGALRVALVAAGIEYQHEPLLGNPRENREPFQSGNVKVGRATYRKRLKNGSAEALNRLSALASHSRVAILCVEREEGQCHRQVIVESIAAAVPGLLVTSLR